MKRVTHRWNPQQSHWIIPHTKVAIELLYSLFLDEKIVVEGCLVEDLSMLVRLLNDY